MAVSDKIKAMMNLKGKKMNELAGHFGISTQAMRNKLGRGSISADDLIRISVFFDAELSFRISDNQTIVLDENDLRENVEAAEMVKKFKKLDKHIHEIRNEKMYRNEYPTNANGIMEIPVISDDDKPGDVDEQFWADFMIWKKSRM